MRGEGLVDVRRAHGGKAWLDGGWALGDGVSGVEKARLRCGAFVRARRNCIRAMRRMAIRKLYEGLERPLIEDIMEIVSVTYGWHRTDCMTDGKGPSWSAIVLRSVRASA